MIAVKQSYKLFSDKWLATLLFFAILGCKEKYTPNIKSPETGYLVVEGFINSNGITNIKLTRTTKLIDTAKIVFENGAQLFIESDGGESYPLQTSDSGRYHSDALNLNVAEKYRLSIQTANGQQYLSDFSTVRYTPPIDSISWLRDDNGVHIYVNAHDDAKNIKYYQWTFSETWEFHSRFYSHLEWIYSPAGNPIGVTGRPIPVYQCWNTINSTNIILGSTEKLSTDKVYLTLRSIEPASVKLSVLYSIIFRQHALSREAYIFYEKMKKNTEQVGSVFDAQPSELKGNIYNINNSSESVIGFVEVSTEEQKRIFISAAQVPNWGYTQSCFLTEIDNNPDSIMTYGAGLLPIDCVAGCPFVSRFNASQGECVDCTLRGTNVKPDFWP